MIKKQGKPITGAKPQYSKRKPFVPNAKDTSAAAETDIKSAPMPFKNKMTTAQMPTGTGAPGGVSTMEPSIQSGMKRTTPGVKALPSGAPVGQKTMPNQSKQIGGRMGWPPPKRKTGSNEGGYPVKKNARFYGE